MGDFAEIALYQRAQALPEGRRAELMLAYQSQHKDRSTAFLLSLFLGWWGVDRFYLGQVPLGLLKLFTFGGLGLWWFIDLFMIMSAADRRNMSAVQRISAMYGS